MASPNDAPISHRDPNRDPTNGATDPTLGNALERVLEAQQTLVVRRIDLLAEKLSAQGWDFLYASISAVVGSIVALFGWIIAMAGVVDALDDRYARFAVELALGAAHVAAGIAIILYHRRRAAEPTPS
jgi:hypothetical protein